MLTSFLLPIAAVAGLLGSVSAAPRAEHKPKPHCDHKALNTTVFDYTLVANDTLPQIAKRFNRGVCEIARLNRMADPLLVYTGEVLTIPAQICNPDNDSCLLKTLEPTLTCIYGGPHTVLTVTGDTYRKLALQKFNVTLDSLWDATHSGVGPDDVLPVGSAVKIPICEFTRCEFEPYVFTNGTYIDLANQYNVLWGQLGALNWGYNVSTFSKGGGSPTLTLPLNCVALPGFNGSSTT